MNTREFLGRGFAFPPRVDAVTGRFQTVDAEEDIRQAIYIILMTRKGERAMNPDFGCNLHNYVFDMPEMTAVTLAVSEITTALHRWEPRIEEIKVDVDHSRQNEGIVNFNIKYLVRDTNNAANFVFPYYLYEGVGAQ